MNYLFVALGLLISVLLARLVIPKILAIAIRYSLYDISDDKRKIHTGAIPRIGGVSFTPCILISMLFVIGIFYMFVGGAENHGYYPNIPEFSFFFCGLLLMYLGGIKDDLIGMRYRTKFIFQIISSLFIVFSGLYINDFHGFFGIYEISPLIGIPLTVLVLVFIINAINMIDGIDGLASGISIFALCIYGILFFIQGTWFYSALAFSTIGVLVIFFFYNVFGNEKKGQKLFMGDSGSLTLGLILGFLAIRYAFHTSNTINPIGNVLVIAVSPILLPMLDVVRVMLLRAKRHKHLFSPDRNHIHHKLMEMGLCKSKALILLLCMTSSLCTANFLLMKHWNCSYIFVLDIALWTLMNMCFTYLIKRRGLQQISLNRKKREKKEDSNFVVVDRRA